MSIENALISSTSITMMEHGVLTFYVTLEGDGWGCSIGGYVIGHGYLGASAFKSQSGSGLVAMMRIMDTVGVESWEDLEGKYCRVKTEGWGGKILEIGNLISDKWFDIGAFFKNEREAAEE